VVLTGAGSPRRDSAGSLCCEQCSTRLSRCKGKLHVQDPGHICQACYDKKRRPLLSAAAEASPPPKRRRATSDPGEHNSTTLSAEIMRYPSGAPMCPNTERKESH
jgi:hypothetical protein